MNKKIQSISEMSLGKPDLKGSIVTTAILSITTYQCNVRQMIVNVLYFVFRQKLVQILKSPAMVKVCLQIQTVTNQVESHGVTGHHCRYMNSQLIWFTNLVCMSFLSTASNAEIKYYQTLRKNLDILEAS